MKRLILIFVILGVCHQKTYATWEFTVIDNIPFAIESSDNTYKIGAAYLRYNTALQYFLGHYTYSGNRVEFVYPENFIIPSSGCPYGGGTTLPITTICELAGMWRPNNTTTYISCNAHNVTSIVIPNSVTRIEENAFRNFTALQWVNIPDGVTFIGDSVFMNDTSLTSITIPSSVTHIGVDAFKNCTHLQTVIYTGTLAQWCSIDFGKGGNPISITNSLYINYLPVEGTITIPDGITHIENHAFNGLTTLTSVSLPNSVISVGEHAFDSCTSITSINIPATTTSFGASAFAGCTALSSVNYNGTLTQWCNIDFADSTANPVCLSHNLNIGGNAVNGRLSIPEEISIIKKYAFYGLSPINSLSLPISVSTIDTGAFIGCGITSVIWNATCSTATNNIIPCFDTLVLGNNVTSIPTGLASRSCLKYLTLGTGITNIGTTELTSASGLLKITLKGNPPTVLPTSLNDVPSSCILQVPCGLANFYRIANGWSRFTNIIEGFHFDVGEGRQEHGEVVVLTHPNCASPTAVIRVDPDEGWYFRCWSDGNTDNPRTLTLVSDTILSAVLYSTVHLHLYSNDTIMGSVVGDTIVTLGTTTTITAAAKRGFAFWAWSDSSHANPYTFTALNDLSLTAIFISQSPIHDTTYIDIPYPVHDTTYIDVHDTTYVDVPYPVHDTTIVHDTTYVDVPYPVHDTTIVHDTTFVDVPYPVHDTTIVHDTAYVDVPYPVHDTTIVHDTTYVDVPYPVHDTTIVHDTTYVDVPYPVHDTTIVHDTAYVDVPHPVHDTTIVTITDTISIHDTTTVFQTDTLWLHDTVFVHDTIYIHDTVVVGVDEVDAINAKIYTSNGQIVVDGAECNTVWLYDVNGRILATKQDEYSPLHFDVPASGTYLVKIGDHPARKVVVIR